MEGRAPAVPHLPDELVVEILARLPAKSLCRFKCVSRSWHRLICDPAHRAKLAQTLSGFFVFPRGRSADACPAPCHFVSLSLGGNDGPPLVDTALSFLPPICGQIELLDSCNGLLLLLCWGAPPLPVHPFYVVCNPATREWLELPQPSEVPGQDGDVLEMGENKRTRNAVLGFDPAISLNFHVFQLLETECQTDYKIEAVEIYSSEAGRWILSKCGWGEGGFHIFGGSMTYLNSALHFTVQSGAVAAVDTRERHAGSTVCFQNSMSVMERASYFTLRGACFTCLMTTEGILCRSMFLRIDAARSGLSSTTSARAQHPPGTLRYRLAPPEHQLTVISSLPGIVSSQSFSFVLFIIQFHVLKLRSF